jgi:hypothetical protein
MSYRTLVVPVVLAFIGGPMAKADVGKAIARLEEFKAGDGSPVLNESIAEIRSGAAAGDAAIWKRLRAIIENPTIPLRVRTEVLRVGLEKADEDIAKDMLALFDAWSAQIPVSDKSTRETRTFEEAEANARITLSGHFIRALRGSPWNRWLGTETRTYDMLERTIVRTTPGMDINHNAIEALVANDASPEHRRAVAARIVSSRPGCTEHEPELLELLDSSCYENLRTLVRKTDDPDRFHFGAAAALAHLGDSAIRADLESLAPVFQKKDRNIGGILNYYLWQIEVQHPLEKLVEYIAKGPQNDVEKRKWAVRRAVQMGMPRATIREAVLKHASLAQQAGKAGVPPGLSSLKALCLDLKVLDPSDLPGVKVAEGAPTP